eukprot:7831887-Ditylum_brightwellii.AAC.1
MNTTIITFSAVKAVSMITDNLRTKKKASTVKEAHFEHDEVLHVTMGDSDSTSTTTATTKSSVSHMPEVTKSKKSRLKSSLTYIHRSRSLKRVQINLEKPYDKLRDGEKINVTNENQE